VQPILNVWGGVKPTDFPNYAAGSWGPPSADQLLAPEGDTWHEAGT
jgi:glucose-6-phosphate 1-dehydrogenase